MEKLEAEGKLRHYQEDYGPSIFTHPASHFRKRADEHRSEAGETLDYKVRNRLLSRAVQLTAIAECIDVIDPDRQMPGYIPDHPDVVRVNRDPAQVPVDVDFIAEGGQGPYVVEDPDLYTVQDMRNVRKPLYHIGEVLYLQAVVKGDELPEDGVRSYLPSLIIGVNALRDSVAYFVALATEDPAVFADYGMCACETLFHREVPDEAPVNLPSKRGNLSVVRS